MIFSRGGGYFKAAWISEPLFCRMATVNLSSLSNSIKWTVSEGDRVKVVLAQEQTNEKAESGEKALSDGADTQGSAIPENVLQYERQLRKVQANQRSLASLTMEKHLKIVYEDENLIVTNKPAGVLCVPGINDKPNLLDLVCQHCDLPKESASSCIVHRLDMDTSGLVLFAKTEPALKNLQAAFRDRRVDKHYQALLCGHLPKECKSGDIHLPLQRDHRHPPFMRIATPRSEAAAAQAVKDLRTHGFKKLVKKRPKPSHTEFSVIDREYFNHKLPVTRVGLVPHTGRTHQLRVHCAAMGYPILGDPAYGLYGEANAQGGLDESTFGASLDLQQQITKGRPPHENSMCLHAATLSLRHPISGEKMTWEAPTPF